MPRTFPEGRVTAVSPAYDPVVHYRVLGPLVPTSASVQQRLLLCFLLVHANRFVSAERLAEELWPDGMPVDPSAALRTQVSRLRRRLPTDALVTEPGGYRLAVGEGDLDSAVFDTLVREGDVDAALALWRGPALEEFADRPFAQGEAMRLEQLRVQAEEERARQLLARGDAASAARAADAVLAEHPDRESLRAVLMEALYRSGRQGAALDVYQSWRRELVDQFGLDPAPELSSLQERILRHRLPLPGALTKPVDSFLGRDDDLREVGELLRSARLVTLTGSGGVGKTRLALEAAHAHAGSFPDGAAICELASVSQPEAVLRAVGWSIGLTDMGSSPLTDQLVAHLRSRRMLLVLDGCEHVLDSAAALASMLIRRTDTTTVLATSRERLAVAGEQVRPVAPLGPTASVRLFRDRARAVTAELAVTDEQVADVCSRLDGLPLAVELAAARAGSLRVEEMVSALDDRFSVLEDRRRSLAATLRWSYELLSDTERDALCLLSAFVGSFDRQAAAAMGVETGVLLRLAERSLVDGANPYRLLDSVRDYARERLREQDHVAQVTQQHAEWVLQLATTAAQGLATEQEEHWAQRLELHHAELRAAHEWLVVQDPDHAVELVAALRGWALWRANAEVFHWAEKLAEATASPVAAAAASTGAWQRGDLARAAELAHSALPHRWAVETLGEVAFLGGRADDAQRHYRQAAELARAAGDGLQETWCSGSVVLAAVYAGRDVGAESDAVLGLAQELGSPTARAIAHFVAGEARRSTPALLESIRLADSVGSRFVAGLARVALASQQAAGDPVAALDHYAHVIQQWGDSGAWTPLWVTLRTVIALLTELGAAQEAAVLHGANLAATHGAPAYGQDAALLEATEARLRNELGVEAFTAHQSRGGSLDEEATVAYALAAIGSARARLEPAST
jgi:predicted ATPase/DNA-binding SARP family transcriptional activator